MVGESQGKSKYYGAKVNKDAEKKLWTVLCWLFVQQFKKFFCSLCLQIIYISAFKFVLPLLFIVRLQVIES